MRETATVSMAAPPDKVWALVSDVTRIGEFSPETFEAEWLGGATGPAVGARFRGHVKRNERGPVYWTVCRVVACEPGREFTFAVTAPGAGELTRWGYLLDPTDTGTEVTEFFEAAPSLPMRLYWMLAGRWRGRRNRNDMRRTLERMKAVVERA
ncbi:SRPBCC family protein [Skermania piniformis]|uniref:SRPBCC family protein n=1 Tax=Skermania pinensis TaxID=39122 RepID=A0ABX8S3I7_9ACTN|nr:SRPBCC family protein [Skermania piniformis]QXQ12384.1 SRPBCC family protein [Skermania piniformis]